MIKVIASTVISSSVLLGGFGLTKEKLSEKDKEIQEVESYLEERQINVNILDQMIDEIYEVKTLFSIDEIKEMSLEEIEMLHEEEKKIKMKYYQEYTEYFEEINNVLEDNDL